MSHTTFLPRNWIAMHDGSPRLGSEIIFRKIDTTGMASKSDVKIPYGVIFHFVAEMVRNDKIKNLENAPSTEVFGL